MGWFLVLYPNWLFLHFYNHFLEVTVIILKLMDYMNRGIYLDYFGREMVNDLNNYIYAMLSENYSYGLGGRYFGDAMLIKYTNSGDQLWRVIFNLRL